MSPAVSLRAPGSTQPLSPHALVAASPFVGADLSTTPHASAYGTVTRLIRLNVLRPSDLSALLGIRVQRTQNLATVMTFSQARQARLAEALRLPDVPPNWNLSAWFPFAAPSTLLEAGWTFRYCPQCLRFGYHTLLHQLPWFGRCPWHGAELRTTCEGCDSRVDTRATWADGEDLVCACGQARVDTDASIAGTVAPPAGAVPFLDEYLAWASRERACSSLATPEAVALSGHALAGVVELPRRWWPWATPLGRRHVRVWHNVQRTAPGALQALTEFQTLRRDRPGFLRLSANHARACSQVAADLALKLPARTLSDGEMTLFLAGAGIAAPASFEPARRAFSAEVSSLVPWRTGGGDFLNLTCLHPAAYRPLVAVLDIALAGRSLADFHAQAAAGELDLLLRCCGDVLARGYAEGLRSVLAPHVPELWQLGRDRPHLSQPRLVVRRYGDRLASIRAVWDPLPVGPQQEADLIQVEDEANRRRARYAGVGRKKKPK
jgi:hypothetical protein